MRTPLPTRKEDDGRVVVDSSRLETATIVVNIDGAELLRIPISLADLEGEPLSYVERDFARDYIHEVIGGRLEITVKRRFHAVEVTDEVRRQIRLPLVDLGTYVIFDTDTDTWYRTPTMLKKDAEDRARELEAEHAEEPGGST